MYDSNCHAWISSSSKPGNVLETQTLESHPISNDLETLRVAPRTLCTGVKDANARPNRRMGPAPHSLGNYSAPGLSSSRLAHVSFQPHLPQTSHPTFCRPSGHGLSPGSPPPSSSSKVRPQMLRFRTHSRGADRARGQDGRPLEGGSEQGGPEGGRPDGVAWQLPFRAPGPRPLTLPTSASELQPSSSWKRSK